MATAIVMPKLSFVVTEGTILEWLKQPGDQVEKGEPLLAIESEKATVDVEAPGTGVLGSELAPVGTTVPVTTIIGYILEPGEPSPELKLETHAEAEAAAGTDEPGDREGETPRSAQPRAANGRIKASPSAKRVAREHDVDLTEVVGSGPGGRIVSQDIEAFLEASCQQEAEAEEPAVTPVARNLASHLELDLNDVEGTGRGGRVTSADVQRAARGEPQTIPGPDADACEEPLNTVQRIAAERMSFSFREVPHFYLTVLIDMSQVVFLREQLLPVIESRRGIRLSYNDVLTLAVSRALRAHPAMNASYADGKLRKHRRVNVGLAVDTPRGLVVPVIDDADQLRLEEIAAKRETAVEKARQNRLAPEDLSGGTFTVSNLGMFGVDVFGAIINPPEAGILAVGKIEKRPIVVGDDLEIRPTMWVTLSVDHRTTDGANAARFLQTLVSFLEAPYQLLIRPCDETRG